MSMTIDSIDLASRAFWMQTTAERDEAFAILRRENPVPWSGPAESDLLPPEDNLDGFWSLTKYDDIRMASRSPEIFSSGKGVTMEDFPIEMVEGAQSFIAMDAPRHTQLRGITMDAFRPPNMRRLEGWIRDHARDLIEEVAPLGGGDFVDLVSIHLPGRIFASFFGIPPGEMYDRAVGAAHRVLTWTDPEACGDMGGLDVFATNIIELRMVAAELAAMRRAEPGEDLMTWITQAEFEGQRMTDDEIGAFFALLAVGSNDTTRHASAHAIHILTQFPEQRALLISDIDAHVDGAVEEILRWSSVFHHMRRTAAQDVTVRGTDIKAGDKVVLWYCSGNRDEDFFPDPFTFDITRKRNNHQTFGGGGPHLCLGAALARTMLRALLTEVYTRMPDIEAPEPDYLVANFIHGIKRLPATWTPPA